MYLPYKLKTECQYKMFRALSVKTLNQLFHFKIQNRHFIRKSYHNNEPVHEISNNVVCATSKASDQPAHTRSLIRAFASRLSIL